MKRYARPAAVLLLAGLTVGCVERRYVVYSDPPGAMVYRNGVQLGPTPVDDYYVYYGKYNLVLTKEGYETLTVQQNIPAPWYDWPGIDFVTENFIPYMFRDVRRFTYTLRPLAPPRPDDLLQRARELRSRGQAVGAQQQPPPPPPPAAPAVPGPAPATPVSRDGAAPK